MSSTGKSLKRYNLALPEELFNKLQEVAESQHTTVVEILRQLIKLGLYVYETPGAALIIREGDKEERLMLFFPNKSPS